MCLSGSFDVWAETVNHFVIPVLFTGRLPIQGINEELIRRGCSSARGTAPCLNTPQRNEVTHLESRIAASDAPALKYGED
jgi:hypothetical protein